MARAGDTSITWETLPWDRDPRQVLSRSQRARITSRYEAAIPRRIATLAPTITADAAAAADDARAEISRFDAELSTLLPGAELAPLASVLLRTESASSSQIEDVTAGARALAMAELDLARPGSNAQLVAANVEAMRRAVELVEEISPASILAVHAALMHGTPTADPGAFRDQQVWVGGSSVSPHGASFVAPHHDRVPAAIDDLCAFIGRTDVPLVVQCAIAHAQFETIHPFVDGNGRVGRALVHAMLQHSGATTRATVPVSAGLLGDTRSYVDALTAYREGDASPIVTRFADAAFAAIGNGRQLAHDLVEFGRGPPQHHRRDRPATPRSRILGTAVDPAVGILDHDGRLVGSLGRIGHRHRHRRRPDDVALLLRRGLRRPELRGGSGDRIRTRVRGAAIRRHHRGGRCLIRGCARPGAAGHDSQRRNTCDHKRRRARYLVHDQNVLNPFAVHVNYARDLGVRICRNSLMTTAFGC